MEAGALTEPLLPRGRDDRSTGPADTVVNIAAATPSATTTPARAASVAAATAARTSRSPSPGRRSDLPLSASDASGATAAASNAASPRLTPRSPSRGGELPPSSSDALLPPAGSATAGAGLPPPTGGGMDISASAGVAPPPPPRPALPATFSDTLVHATVSSSAAYNGGVTPAASAPGSPAGRVSSSPLFRARNSPRSTADEILPEDVGEDAAGQPGSRRKTTAAAGRSRLGFRVPRSGRHPHRRAGLRVKVAPQQDFWSKESFIYMCVMMVFAGLIAYLGTMIEGWASYLRITFIIIFGVATGLACTGAMAIVSYHPVPSTTLCTHCI